MRFFLPLRRLVRSLALPRPPAGQRWIVFDDGRVAFLAPRGFAMHREENETVAVYPPGEDSGITLRLTLHPELLDSRLPADAAEVFLRELAGQRGLDLVPLGSGMAFTESATCDDGPYGEALAHFWQVAIGRIHVVASATIWARDRSIPTVAEGLAAAPAILATLRRT